MCGLIATIDYSTSKFFFPDSEAFFSMLLLNSLRGAHSTGAFAVRNDGRSEYIKAVGSPYVLDKYKDWDDFLHRIPIKYTALVGHGRFATKGAINIKNAHPFRRGKITLVHNGTISNFEELKKLYTPKDTFEVDSDLCANLFHSHTPAEAIEKIEGAFAFIFFDEEENKLKIVRNYERPLYFFKRKDKQQYIFASDEAIFGWLKAKHGMRGESEMLPANILHTFSFDKEEYQTEQIKTHTKVYPVYGGYGGNDSEYEEWGNWNKKEKDYNNAKTYDLPYRKRENLTEKIVNAAFGGLKEKLKDAGQKKSTYKFGDVNLIIGDKIKWIPNDYRESVDRTTKETKTFLIGSLENCPLSIEVNAITKLSINDLLADSPLVGKIKSLTVFPPDNELHCRIFVDEVETVKSGENTKTNSVEWYTLYDKARIRESEFKNMAAFGCGTCKAPILAQQADFILMIGSSLYCPDCTVHAKYPKN